MLTARNLYFIVCCFAWV